MKMNKLLVPTALFLWVVIVVAAVSYTPEEYEAENGSVHGILLPEDVGAYIYLMQEEEIVATVRRDPGDAEFNITDVPEGVYTVVIEPVSEEYEPETIEEITVDAGETTELGEIVLEPNGDGETE
jgi:hypothetical protein